MRITIKNRQNLCVHNLELNINEFRVDFEMSAVCTHTMLY